MDLEQKKENGDLRELDDFEFFMEALLEFGTERRFTRKDELNWRKKSPKTETQVAYLKPLFRRRHHLLILIEHGYLKQQMMRIIRDECIL